MLLSLKYFVIHKFWFNFHGKSHYSFSTALGRREGAMWEATGRIH